jgi:hypothetical protein
MARIHISKDPSGQRAVTFAHDPLMVDNVKTVFSLELKYFRSFLQIVPIT